MASRFEVYLDPRLKPRLEELLGNAEIITQLVQHGLTEDAKGIAKLAVYKFLEARGIFPTSTRSANNTNSEQPHP